MAKSGKSVTELAELVGALVEDGDDVLVTDVTNDSREVADGFMYVAVRGARSDGHEFVGTAVDAGAVAVCVDHPMGSGVPELMVEDTREVMGDLASAVHAHPSTSVDVVGVTGTNGKTTVTHYIESIGTRAGLSTGLVGTIHARAGDVSMPSSLTTPEAPAFQRLLAGMRDRGVSLVAAEVSSHALEFGRVRGTRFAVAAFTNLSQDHLDFHGDMDAYRAAKRRLFTEYEVGTAVINVDDPTGADIAGGYEGELVTVGSGGDYSLRSVDTHPSRSVFTVDTPGGVVSLEAPVIGEFNVRNLVLAGACCVAAGLDHEIVFEAMSEVGGVPGRFEVVSGDDAITVIVDYAHTPEGVAMAVDTARDLVPGKVIALLGAGGDRDRRKRPAMGSAISAADLAIITSDNPRSENPESIIAQVVSGLDPGADRLVEVNRREAIAMAINAAADGDIVLILGRGHETHQQIGEGSIEFDDRQVAAELLARRRRGAAGSGGASGSMST